MSPASNAGSAEGRGGASHDDAAPPVERRAPEVGFLTRLSFAAHLEAEPYGEIARDPACSWQVSVVVALAGLAHGVAFYSSFGPAALVVATIGALSFWLVLSSSIFLLGRLLAPEPVGWGVVTRGVGVAAFAMVLVAISAIGQHELLKLGIHVLAYSISIAAVVVATHEVLRVSVARALAIGLGAIALTAAGVVLLLPWVVG
jgi:hypothetical protein